MHGSTSTPMLRRVYKERYHRIKTLLQRNNDIINKLDHCIRNYFAREGAKLMLGLDKCVYRED